MRGRSDAILCAMESRPLAGYPKRERRRLVAKTILVIFVSWTALIGAYYLIPFDDHTAAGALLRLIVGMVILVAVLVWLLFGILSAENPGLRALEALSVIVVLLTVVFAATYLSIVSESPHSFNQGLDHNSALYFTITVLATVGFGDIVPVNDFARMVVSLQMIVDLVFIAAVVRVIINAAKIGQARHEHR
jgi:voltage-gated potassium channel